MTDTWLAVGSPYEGNGNDGAVYLYRNVSGVWTAHSRVQPLFNKSGDWFGQSVALDGTRLVVGAPFAGSFPTGVAQAGAVYLFEFNGTAWEQKAERFSPNVTTNGWFGFSVDIHGDVIVVGAPDENDNKGRVYDTRDLNTLTNFVDVTPTTITSAMNFGFSVAVYDPAPSTPDDESIAVGANNNPALQAFVLSGTGFNTVTTLTRPSGSTGSFYGYDVDIYNGRVAVGDPSSPGPSYVHVFSGAGYNTVSSLTSPDADALGFSLALDDTRLLAGAYNSNNGAGRAVIFKRSGETWTQEDVFAPAELQANDSLGYAVAMDNGLFAAAAPFQTNVPLDGAVYLFEATPEVVVNPITALSVAEEGTTTDSFTVALNVTPPSNVTTTLTFDANVQVDTGSGFGASPQTVTLTPANALSGVTVTVRAVDDTVVEADPHSVTLTTATTSSDANYHGLAVSAVTVSITDNDTATPPDSFVLQSPVNQAFFVDVSTLTAFRWQDTAATTPGLTFDVSVTRIQPDEPDTVVLTFTNITRDADTDTLACNGTQCVLTIGALEQALLTDGVYQWTVTAKNLIGNTPASAPFTFTVNNGGELLVNGGFETAAPKPINAAKWKRVTMTTYDVRVCGNPAQVHSGTCAYRFRFPTSGVLINQTRTLQQFINAPTFGVAGDTLTLSAFVRTNKLSGAARLRLEVTYATGSPQIINIRIPAGTNAYAQLSKPLVLTGHPTSIRVYISALKRRGVFFVDDISLKFTPIASPLAPEPEPNTDGIVPLPLPPAPVTPQTQTPPTDIITLPALPTEND